MSTLGFKIFANTFRQFPVFKAAAKSSLFHYSTREFSKGFSVKSISKNPKHVIIATIPAALVAGYYLYNGEDARPTGNMAKQINYELLNSKPDVAISRSVAGDIENFNLKLTLFQYPTCPFCCKVRAFLDYYGLPYDVIEVDPVLRQQTSWTTYKKVPILLAEVEGGYQQLTDSSMIISALKTFLSNGDSNLKDIVNYYPIIVYDEEKKGKEGVLNKYFVMYQNNKHPSKIILEEKKWREWADEELVHTLSPNVYRTQEEALQAFNWFSEVGEWDRLFPAWERNLIVYVGAFAMWIIGKRLKKRHQLKEDVRQSLYDACEKWMKVISEKKTTFLGGKVPNLADLAVYGVLSSIEGCTAFTDLLNNTKIGKWYFPMKEAVQNHKGKLEQLT